MRSFSEHVEHLIQTHSGAEVDESLDLAGAALTDFTFGAAEDHVRSEEESRDALALGDFAAIDREDPAATVVQG
jgi:hypothetical protein